MSPVFLHHYDPITFVQTHSEPARRDPFDECWVIPSFATMAALVEIKAGVKNVVNVYSTEQGAWLLQPDFIGQEFYQKDNGNKVIIDKIGEIPDTLTSKIRPEPWFVFDEKQDDWVMDEALYAGHFANMKTLKQLETAQAAQAYIDAVTNDYAPVFERESYTLQAEEAKLWDKDNQASTPILDGIALARGVDADDLKRKALEKSQNYQELCAKISGQRQALEDQINAAKTVEEVEAINPSEIFKVSS